MMLGSRLVTASVLTTALCAAALVCVGAAPATQPADDGDELTPAERAQRDARIAALIKQLGDDEWRTREAASKALAEIGRPALEALKKAATTSKDAEVVWRAEALVKQIGSFVPGKVDPKCTNGYQMVYQGVEQVQTFKATIDRSEKLRVRLARTLWVPTANLTVTLRDPAKKDAAALATASIQGNWFDAKGVSRGVTRFFQWFDLDFKAAKLENGKTYELVFSSITAKTSPWLVSCFYRDVYADGEHRQRSGGKTAALGKFDLAFEIQAGEATLTSVPKGMDLPDRKEEYGLGHDGRDLHKQAAPPNQFVLPAI